MDCGDSYTLLGMDYKALGYFLEGIFGVQVVE